MKKPSFSKRGTGISVIVVEGSAKVTLFLLLHCIGVFLFFGGVLTRLD